MLIAFLVLLVIGIGSAVSAAFVERHRNRAHIENYYLACQPVAIINALAPIEEPAEESAMVTEAA